MQVASIILAAGKASRFGEPKPLLELDGKTLVQRAARLSSDAGCSPNIVLSGKYHDQIKRCSFPENTQLLYHEEWSEGMGSSIALGVKKVMSFKVDAVLILLVDQPAITPQTIEEMFIQLKEGDASIILCDNGESTGPPALFCARHFPELLMLDGDFGGKAVIKKNRSSVATIPASEAWWDIDTPEVWIEFLLQFNSSKK